MARTEFTVADAYRYNTSTTVNWIFSHILRYWWLPVVIILGNIATSGMYSFASITIGRAFDLVGSATRTTAGDTAVAVGGSLLTLTLLVLVARCGQGFVDLGKFYAVEMMAQRLERDAREELYISLLGKSQTFHNRQQVGDIMARATNDVQQLSLMISPGAGLIIESVLFVIVPIVGIATIRLELVLVPVIFIITFVFALRQYSSQLNPVSGAMRQSFGELNAGLAESVSGIEVVKGYAQEPQELQRFSKHARNYRDYFVQEGQIKARYLPLLLYGVAYGAAFGHALLLYLNGGLTVGNIIGFMSLMAILAFPTFISLFTFSLVQLGIAGAGRILELIKAETELDENAAGSSQPMHGEIEFQHVSFGYVDEAPVAPDDAGEPIKPASSVLHNISFHARPGATVAIVGQTGSGKSTLTKLVNRTYDATEGRVLIDGVDVREWSLDSLRGADFDELNRISFYFHARLRTTSHLVRRSRPPANRLSRRRRKRKPTSLSSRCPRATTRLLASAALRFLAASASGLQLPVRS